MIWWMERRAAETDGGELISWELVHLWLSADTWSAGLKYNCHSQRTISGLGEALQWKMLVCQWVQLFRLRLRLSLQLLDGLLIGSSTTRLTVFWFWGLKCLDIYWIEYHEPLKFFTFPKKFPTAYCSVGVISEKKKRNVHTLHNLIVFKSFTSQMSLKHLSRMRATKQPQQQQHCGNSGYLTFD